MNKRIRSRVLTASIVSSTLLGTGGLLYPQGVLLAQDRPSASDLLARGTRLYEQKQYGEAKKILTDIDPAQLPEDQRSKLADLITRTDQALAQALGPNGAFDAAQANLDAGKLASASSGFDAIINSPTAPADVKDKARVQLALVKEKQKSLAPQMKELLAQAQSLYDQGKLDEASNALDTIQATGADLGWDNNAKPALLRQRINEKRTAMANAGNAAAPAAAATVAPEAAPATAPAVAVAPTPDPMAAPTAPPAPVAAAPAANPLDVMPAGQAAPANGGGLLQQEVVTDAARRDRALALYTDALRQSDAALAANPPQFNQAEARAQEAIDIIDRNRLYFSDAEAALHRDAAQRALNAATARAQDWAAKDAVEAEAQARAEAARRAEAIKTRRKVQINKLVADAQKLYDVAQFKEAADLLRQAVLIDPQDASARLMLRMVEDKINNRAYQTLVNKRSTETVRQELDNVEKLIPYADLMIYPDNWIDITRKRLGSDANQDSPANRVARERLESNLREITAEQQGLEKVVSFLRDTTNTNIFVNWKALEAAGVDRNTPVSVSLRDVPFRKALTTILSEVGGGTANLAYTIDEGIITISTRDDLNSAKYQIVRVFDIRDLLVQPTNKQPPSLNLGSQTRSGTGGGGSGSGTGLFGDNGGGNQDNRNPAEIRTAIVASITETIQNTVSPESWRDKGGTIGSIRELNGQLIVNQTVDNQIEVMNLLQQLRETRAIQIAVEARLLLVDNHFLDDFRVGWNIAFPAGQLGNNVGAVSFGNLNTMTNANPATLNTGVGGSLGTFGNSPSLSLGATIIDNWTLSLLLAATQADQRTITVTAPRVTIFNGQRGFIAVIQQQNFVSSFNQTVASGGQFGGAAVGTQVEITTLNTGVVLDVEATVSSDRRYVVMNIDPQLSTLQALDTFSLGGTTSNSTTSGSNTSTAVGGAFVQLPKINATRVSTMVSIPDGGTLLIGGQKLVGEAEIEVGVPILSKIPGLNRLFTNRSFVKDERTLLVLVRPTIIIHRELETDLFGAGYDKAIPSNTPTLGSPMPTMSQ